MKIRNKRTGEIIDVYSVDCLECDKIRLRNKAKDETYVIYSIEALNALFEDYKPVEPLIKDEKIRKAVRAWAEVININQDNIKVSIGSHMTSIIGWKPDLIGGYSIDFPNILNELQDGMKTTITELCGEKEE